MEVISIILGVLLLIGLLVLPKDESKNIQDPKLGIIIRGALFIRKFIIPVLALALLGAGVYYYLKNKEENDKRITFDKLMKIVETEQHEKETKILALDFDLLDRDENGSNYSRDSTSGEIIQNWDSGILRYITSDKEKYIRIRSEISNNKAFAFEGEGSNNQGDKFATYKKNGLQISFGVFSSSQQYVTVFADSARLIDLPPIVTAQELAGKWGRIHYLHQGTYSFKPDFTFVYDDSRYGAISGTYKILQKELTLNYNVKNWKYDIKHEFSAKTESIVIKSKEYNEINGYFRGGEGDVILKRQ